MKVNFGIRSQLVAGICLLTSAGIGLIGLLSVKIVESRGVYWKTVQAENTVKLMRFVSAGVAVTQGIPRDEARSFALAVAILREAGITDFKIADPAGNEVIRQGILPRVQGAETIYSVGNFTVKKAGRGWAGWFSDEGGFLYVTAGMDSGSKKGTTLDFIMPLKDIEADMASAKGFLFFYALLDSVIIIGFGLFFLSRFIISPIKKLDEAARRISGGALGERADIKADNELGTLAASFNIMADRVEEEIKALERVNLELMSKEEELLRARTLAAMGRLSAGIAHEIGNPLGALHGYLDILSKGGVDEAERRGMMDGAMKEAGRIDAIVGEFLDLVRPPRPASAPVDVNAVIRDTVKSAALHKDLKGTDIRADLKDGLPALGIDDGKLRQVFLNLLLNAGQAIRDTDAGSKQIFVETGVSQYPPGISGLRRRSDGSSEGNAPARNLRQYVFVNFIDAGVGICPDDAKKIFDPFFTTKDLARGTGLGLFVSQAIISAYGGEITFKSAPGEGSTFTVILPVEGKGDIDGRA